MDETTKQRRAAKNRRAVRVYWAVYSDDGLLIPGTVRSAKRESTNAWAGLFAATAAMRRKAGLRVAGTTWRYWQRHGYTCVPVRVTAVRP